MGRLVDERWVRWVDLASGVGSLWHRRRGDVAERTACGLWVPDPGAKQVTDADRFRLIGKRKCRACLWPAARRVGT